MSYILEIKNLQKHYRDFSLKNVSFNLPAGYIMGLIGPNGSGKTTIIKLIMNLIKREQGEIAIFGKDNLACEAEVKTRIGFVYDIPRFPEDVCLQDIYRAYSMFYPDWDHTLFQSLAAGILVLPSIPAKFAAV